MRIFFSAAKKAFQACDDADIAVGLACQNGGPQYKLDRLFGYALFVREETESAGGRVKRKRGSERRREERGRDEERERERERAETERELGFRV